MKAIMVEDEYLNLQLNTPYEIDKVHATTYISINKRRYCSRHFVLMDDNEKVSHAEAYRRFKNKKS